MGLKAVILAAGKGTRMKSDILKVVHQVAGKPIVNYVVETVSHLGAEDIYIVVGHQADLVKKNTPQKNTHFVYQEEQLGTGHAVLQVKPYIDLSKETTLIILAGDCPLIEEETLVNLIAIHEESNSLGTILTAIMDEPGSYGRILRGQMGTVTGIKEAKDCTDEEKEICEINTGVYVFNSQALFGNLALVDTNNTQREYYLTDVIHLIKESGGAIGAYCCENSDHVIGINTRADLAKINKIIYQKNNIHFMQEGITIIDPETTFIDSTVQIGWDTIISPFTVIGGHSQIGSHCTIGAHSYIYDGNIANNSTVAPFTHIQG